MDGGRSMAVKIMKEGCTHCNGELHPVNYSNASILVVHQLHFSHFQISLC
ncbi:hypothetical protein QJS10_CPB20g00213 [Acorus calamus]|uniref:Uncharacterized protein n=1 Tax=Acorus calamus TaxID=4465 RepID=A0AAV9CEI5_ACOCL|nr:hypothetical protein QJS10_CPB20g00213 [Acorus calamus]